MPDPLYDTDIAATHDSLEHNDDNLVTSHEDVRAAQVTNGLGEEAIGDPGRELAVSETQFDNDLVAPHGESSNIQNVLRVHKQSQDQDGSAGLAVDTPATFHTPLLTTVTLFSRPMDEEIGTGQGFTYGKASKPPLDMRGIRKGGTAAASLEPTTAIEGQNQEQGFDGDASIAPANTDYANGAADRQLIEGLGNAHIPLAPNIDTAVSTPMQTAASVLIRKKRKKRVLQSSNLAGPNKEQGAVPVLLNSAEPHTKDQVQTFAYVGRAAELDTATQYREQNTGGSGHYAGVAQQKGMILHHPIASAQTNLDDLGMVVDARPHVGGPYVTAIDAERTEEAFAELPKQPHLTDVLPSSTRDAGHADWHGMLSRNSRRRSRHSTYHREREPESDAVSQTMEEALEDIHDKHQREKSKARADVQKLNAELEQTVEAREALQVKLNHTLQQNDKIATMLKQQEGKVSAYKVKLKSFQTFMDTMKTDLADLKRTHKEMSKAKERLIHTCQERELEHEDLYKRLQQMATRVANDREQGLEASRELKTELDAARVRNEYLESYLSDTKGSLIEERDRRSQVEAQLAAMAETLSTTHHHHEAVLEKLEEIDIVLSASTAREQLTGFVEKVSAALRGLDGQQTDTANDVVSVIELLKTLSEELMTAKKREGEADANDAILPQIRASLRDAFTELKSDLEQREQLMQQDAAQQESFAILQDRHQTTSDQCRDLQAQLNSLRQDELQLQNSNTSLRAKLTALENVSQPEMTPGNVTDGDEDALSAAKLDLHSKTEELQAIRSELNDAHEQLQSLRIQVQEAHRRSTKAATQRERLQDDLETQLDRVRSEMRRHSDKVLDERMAEYKNRMRELMSESELYSNRVQPLQLELLASQAVIAEAHQAAASTQAKHEEALLRATGEAQSWKQKAEANGSMAEESTKQSLGGVSHKLAAAQTDYERTIEQKAALTKHIEGLQMAMQQAQKAHDDSDKQLKEQQHQHAASLSDVTEELATANATIERHNAGLKHLTDEFERAMEVEKQKSAINLKAQQDRLTQAQDELQQEKKNGEDFRVEIERAWKADTEEYDGRFKALSRELTQVATQRDQMIAENERFRNQIQDIATQHQQGLEVVASDDTRDVAAPPDARPLVDDITPAVSNKENDPPRPRKKVDRQSLTVIETTPIPILEVLRPDSRQRSADATVRGPVVEESQLQDTTVHVPATQDDNEGGFSTDGRGPLDVIPNVSDDMIDNASLGAQHPSHVVEETQFDDNLPSFAAFNSNTSTAAPRHKIVSVFTVPSAADAHSQGGRAAARREGSLHGPPGTSESFSIYEDQMSQTSLPSQSQLQNSLTWSDAEKEKYTFRKSFPKPNSASKMAPRNDDHDVQHRTESRSNNPAFRTPPFRNVSDRASSNHSSTPDYINAAGTNHQQVNIDSGGYDSVSKRRISRTDSQTKANPDPRLLPRNTAAPLAASKRKAEAPHIAEGYEHERKKRKNAAASKPQNPSGRSSLRTSSQSSINDLPQMPHSSSSRGGPAQSSSRMRTLGGSTSRAARGNKKASKSKLLQVEV
ncbi:hypothetical protein LTR78_001840 [Recurvomyces mirabilis]|uniref:Uncharacterized protein n=1 Tax=Recurvomyces mirabilis TaxID=574656 RepID=A0AAE1C579_9PEZI|nr:hypothetical protein LTR78_001840 [Recurvomyces mirabilis]